ncbi:MAG: helix-turn-helix domain-containing protein [Ruegeria sp.]|uniref:helix-turn-helix domain-containing protein n=1 Tax=Ruegeria sp. TaxID=1879320 RepID=UPI00349EA2EB
MTYCASVPQVATPVAALPMTQTRVNEIDIILPQGTSSSAAQMMADLFNAGNDLVNGAPYRVTVRDLSEQPSEDARYWARRTVIFLGDIHTRWSLSAEERNRVHQILRLATRSVLVGSAVFLLCETGLQERHAVAIHPNFAAAATEEQLAELAPGAHFAASGSVHSAISGFAALRLLLELIGRDHGQFIAGALSDYIGLSADGARPQSKVSLGLRQRAQGDVLIDSTIDLMRDHIEEPLKICELANKLGVSTRKLQRRFLERTGTGPLTAYRALCIERAHQLLVHTSLSLSEVVVATGFGTYSNLARWFRREYGETPQIVRQRAFAGA